MRLIAILVAGAAPVSLATFAAELGYETRVGAGAGAGTLEGALVLAYRNNPQLNAQRAATRFPRRRRGTGAASP